MAREHWIPVGWSYSDQDAAQSELEALKAAGVRYELRGETASGAFTHDDLQTTEPFLRHPCEAVPNLNRTSLMSRPYVS